MVSNLPDAPITVHKHAKLAQMTEKPTAIIKMINHDHDLHEEVESITAIPVYKGKIDRDDQVCQHDRVRGMNGRRLKTTGVSN